MTMTTIQKKLQEEKWQRTISKMQARGGTLSSPPPQTGLCNPDCPECCGSGYVRANPDAEIGDKDFGRVQVCPNYQISLLQGSDLARYGLEQDELCMDWNLVKAKIGYTRLEGTRAVKAVKPAFERGHGMIALLGTYGQGKTLVGKILTARALMRGKRAAYANMDKILDNIRLAYDAKEDMTKELLRRMDYWISLDVLFVDEMDKANETEWALSRMFQLMDQRYTRAVREEALTVIASNKKDDELDGYLVSRLSDHRLGPVIYLDGEDARKIMPPGYRH
jgi:IstB-like ATP binding protein